MEWDLKTIHIDTTLPIEQRAVPLIVSVEDPYRFKVGEVGVVVRFKNKNELSASLARVLSVG